MVTLETMAIWASILALVLGIPMGIAATILTPKILSWWAVRNSARVVERIAKCKRLINTIDKDADYFGQILYDSLTFGITAVILMIGAVWLLSVMSLDFAFLAFAFTTKSAKLMDWANSIPHDLKRLVNEVFLAVLASGISLGVFVNSCSYFVAANREKYRRQVEQELAKLEALCEQNRWPRSTV